MRIGVVVASVALSCAGSRSASQLASHVAPPCYPAEWHTAASSPWRAVLGGREVIVIGLNGTIAGLADESTGVIVAAYRPLSALTPVVATLAPLSEIPGGPPIGAWVEQGAALPDHDDHGWFHIHHVGPVSVDGWIPATASRRVWQPAARHPGRARLERFAHLRAEPDPSAPEIATVDGTLPVALDFTDAPIGWEHVTADDGVALVKGWVAAPRPEQVLARHQVRRLDFSDDTIEGVMPKPSGVGVPVGTCLRAAPSDDAAVIGLVDGMLEHTRETNNAWLEVTVDAPWGPVIGYVRAPPVEPDPPMPFSGP